MMKRREVQAALKFAREQRDKTEADLKRFGYGTAGYESATAFSKLWTGYVLAYESVLQIGAITV